MSRLAFVVPVFVGVALAIALSPDGSLIASAAQKGKLKAGSPEEAATAAVMADKNLKVEVWAAEPLLANPVCFTFDEKGRCFVVETHRHTQGVPDTRGKPWLDDDLACRTVADRLAAFKKYISQYRE